MTLLSRLKLFEVASPLVGPAVTIIFPNDKMKMVTHCFVGARFFDAQGKPAVPGAGSIAIAVRTTNSFPAWEAVAGSPIDGTAAKTLNWAANSLAVRAIPTGLTVIAKWQIVVTANRH